MKTWVAVAVFATCSNCAADSITTFVGKGWIFPQDSTDPRRAPLGLVETVKADGHGNLYFADRGNHKVFRITRTGTLETVAGNGIAGYSGDGGPAQLASLYGPAAAVADSDG